MRTRLSTGNSTSVVGYIASLVGYITTAAMLIGTLVYSSVAIAKWLLPHLDPSTFARACSVLVMMAVSYAIRRWWVNRPHT